MVAVILSGSTEQFRSILGFGILLIFAINAAYFDSASLALPAWMAVPAANPIAAAARSAMHEDRMNTNMVQPQTRFGVPFERSVGGGRISCTDWPS